MKYKVSLRFEVSQDLLNGYNWYESQNFGAGLRFLEEFESILTMIESNALAGTLVYETNRRILMKNFPYGIFYQVDEKNVLILACIDLRRNPAFVKKRNR